MYIQKVKKKKAATQRGMQSWWWVFSAGHKKVFPSFLKEYTRACVLFFLFPICVVRVVFPA